MALCPDKQDIVYLGRSTHPVPDGFLKQPLLLIFGKTIDLREKTPDVYCLELLLILTAELVGKTVSKDIEHISLS